MHRAPMYISGHDQNHCCCRAGQCVHGIDGYCGGSRSDGGPWIDGHHGHGRCTGSRCGAAAVQRAAECRGTDADRHRGVGIEYSAQCTLNAGNGNVTTALLVNDTTASEMYHWRGRVSYTFNDNAAGITAGAVAGGPVADPTRSIFAAALVSPNQTLRAEERAVVPGPTEPDAAGPLRDLREREYRDATVLDHRHRRADQHVIIVEATTSRARAASRSRRACRDRSGDAAPMRHTSAGDRPRADPCRRASSRRSASTT